VNKFYAEIRDDLRLATDALREDDDHRWAVDYTLGALRKLTNHMEQLEARLEAAERTASRAANDASCLANGIVPD